MEHIARATLSVLLFSCFAASPAVGEEKAGLQEALTGGEPTVALRYRFENVGDDAAGDKEAQASTLRTVLGYETQTYGGWTLLLEFENVAAVGNEDRYRNAGAGGLSNGVTDRPVVADPELTDLNQVFARYQGQKTAFTLGRQELVIGDSRFVGNVGWRQNHQSFDALRITNESLGRVELSYSFVDRAHRIFGDTKDMASHLLDASFDAGAAGRLRAYAYLLDYEGAGDAALSTATYGLELTGQHALRGAARLLYELELAHQSDHADNPGTVDAGYQHVLIGAALPVVTVKAALEVLEGSTSGGGFTTPLATLHKFNGWADKFLGTPGAGLEDLYLSVGGKAGKASWVAVFHDFGAEGSSANYGEELDLQVTCSSSWGQQFGLKAAFYDAESFSTDTEKLMLWTSYSF